VIMWKLISNLFLCCYFATQMCQSSAVHVHCESSYGKRRSNFSAVQQLHDCRFKGNFICWLFDFQFDIY